MSFARSIATVSGFTVISRVGGFIRDQLTAIFLGAGTESDAFFVAQKLPNLFRSLFAEGAFTAAFVPLYAAERQKKGFERAQKFAAEALALLVSVLAPFSVLMIVFMPMAILVIAPGFRNEPDKYDLAVSFSRITFPYLLLISITALQGGVLNANNRFAPPAAAPIALNIVMIGGLCLAWKLDLPMGATLSWALLIAGGVQCFWLYISCVRAKLTIPLARPSLGETSARLFKNVGPGAIGAGAAQINIMLSTILASFLPTGAVSFLYYADRLNQLPLGIIGIAVATTLLPTLARHEANGDKDKVRHYTSRAIEFSLLLGLPAAIGLALAGEPIIRTLFEHGKFSSADTAETAKALAAYALCVPAFMLVKVFSARFFAQQDTKTPVVIAIYSMITNVAVALLLFGPLEHVGIALATSVATWANAGQLYWRLRKRGEQIADPKLRQRLPRLALSALGMALATYLAVTFFSQPGVAPLPLLQRVLALGAIIASSAVSYAAFLLMTGALHWGEAANLLRQKGKTT